MTKHLAAESLNRLRGEVIQYHSVSVARIALQACSFNHSDISPFRINQLRTTWNGVAQNVPSRIFVSTSSATSIVSRDVREIIEDELCQTS
jgi:hypothetical protein